MQHKRTKQISVCAALTGAALVLEAVKYFVNEIFFYVFFGIQAAMLAVSLALLILWRLPKRQTAALAALFAAAVIALTVPVCIALAPQRQSAAHLVIHAGGGEAEGSYLNCRESFSAQVQAGHDLIELDFCYTADGQIVATHAFMNMPPYSMENRPTAAQFEAYKLCGKYSGITLPYLAEMLQKYPNVTIVTDVKEQTQLSLLTDLARFCDEKKIDAAERFIAQVYTEQEYLLLREEASLPFERFWFTNYRAQYAPLQIRRAFSAREDIEAIDLHTGDWWALHQRGWDLGKPIAVHTVKTARQINFLACRGVNYVFFDTVPLG